MGIFFAARRVVHHDLQLVEDAAAKLAEDVHVVEGLTIRRRKGIAGINIVKLFFD